MFIKKRKKRKPQSRQWNSIRFFTTEFKFLGEEDSNKLKTQFLTALLNLGGSNMILGSLGLTVLTAARIGL